MYKGRKALILNGKVGCGAMDHVSLRLKLIRWMVPVNAAWLQTAVCPPADLMGITDGCRSEMRLTGRGGKTGTHLPSLYRDVREASVCHKRLENADPVTWYECRVTMIANRKRFDFSKNKHLFNQLTPGFISKNHDCILVLKGLKSQTPYIILQTWMIQIM